MTTITNNKLPEWRTALDKCVENYQSTRAWYEENRDSPAALDDMERAEDQLANFVRKCGFSIVLGLLDEMDELQELRRNYLALRGEIEDVQSQLYEAENQANEYASELQEHRKAAAEPVLYVMGMGCAFDAETASTCKGAVGSWVGEWNQERLPGQEEYKTVPLYTAPPVQETGVYKDMLNIIGLLENNEWAEHCTSTVLGSLLESEITRLVSKEQPAPVVPEEITADGIIGMHECGFVEGWNACRAALLQGGEPVSKTYELPELIEGMEVSVDVSTCDFDAGHRYFGTVTEVSELDTAKNGYILLVQDAKPNFDVNGNSPVIPDGWISCSERMPDKGQRVLVCVDFDSSTVTPLVK